MTSVIGNKIKEKSLLNSVYEIVYLVLLGFFTVVRLVIIVTKWRDTYPAIEQFAARVWDFYLGDFQNVLLFVAIFRLITYHRGKIPLRVFLGGCIILVKVIYNNTGDVYPLLGMLLIVASLGVDAKKVLYNFLFINIPFLILTVTASKVGILENFVEAGRNREYLGYTWTTTPVMIFTYAMLVYIVLRKGSMTAIEYGIISVVNIWLFFKTNTRFAFLIAFGGSSFFYVFMQRHTSKKLGVPPKQLVLLVPWLFELIILLSTIYYNENNKILYAANRILSNRLKQCNYSFNLYGIKTFGQTIYWVTITNATKDNPPTYVDTAYLQPLLKYGWIYMIVILLMVTYLLYRTYKEELPVMTYIILGILVFALTEQQLYWFEYDVFLFIIFADWRKLTQKVPVTVTSRWGHFVKEKVGMLRGVN